MVYRVLSCLLLLALQAGDPASALDQVDFRRNDRKESVRGQMVVTAQDGGVLLMTRAGVLWTIEPDEILAKSHDDRAFVPLSVAEMETALAAELPAGFQVHRTAHYVVGFNTSRAYARWCGGLFERLYGALTNFWKRKGLKLHDPPFPLVAVLFSSASSYRHYAEPELGSAAGSIVGYYSLRSNRMNSYDLTGVQALSRAGSRRGSVAEINRMLRQPAAEPLVATVIHEATHQITFNCGLLKRYTDVPLWVSEGMAVYFETPDLSSAKGWRGIGQVNRSRLEAFRDYLPRRDRQSLAELIGDDRRFRNTKTAPAAYAEAWALNDFLIHRRADQYAEYLTMLAAKPQLLWDDPATRGAEFKASFGSDLQQFDAQFLRHVEKLLRKNR
jgi:hypothetical protein